MSNGFVDLCESEREREKNERAAQPIGIDRFLGQRSRAATSCPSFSRPTNRRRRISMFRPTLTRHEKRRVRRRKDDDGLSNAKHMPRRDYFLASIKPANLRRDFLLRTITLAWVEGCRASARSYARAE